jgi:hypothetical protein
MVRFADLPAADRRAIRAGRATVPCPPTAVRGSSAAGGPAAYRCHRCGDTFPSYRAAERHIDDHHWPGGRIEMILP